MKKSLNICGLVIAIFILALNSNLNAQDIKVACVGNSITQGVGTITFPDQLDAMLGQGWYVRNCGIQGRTLLKHGDYPYWDDTTFTGAMNFLPDIVIIKLGTNDSKPQNWAFSDEFYNDYLSLVDTFAQLSTHPKILLAYPMKAYNHNWDINDSIIVNGIIPLIDSVAKVRSLTTIDLHTFSENKEKFYLDGIHPNSSGNNQIADLLFEYLVDSSRFIVRDQNLLYMKDVTTENASNSTEDKLVDGNFGEEWKAEALPASAIIDLGSENPVDFFQIAFSTDMNKGYQYTIEGSADGTSWTMLADKSQRNDTVSVMSTDSIGVDTARYIRLTITSFSNSSDNIVKIAEFKAYKYTGYEHAPMISLKRVNKTTASTWIKRDHPGDAVSYFGASNDLDNFLMINFSKSTSKLINFNSIGTVGNTNSYYTVNYMNGIKIISDTSTYTFQADIPTGINTIDASDNAVAYPNPFTDHITFANPFESVGQELSVKIYDVTGQLITIVNSKNGQLSWDGKDMNSKEVPAGIYICSIESSNSISSKKVIVSKK